MGVTDSKTHYNLLIEEGIDFVHDSEPLSQYMQNWDGELFYSLLEVDASKTVLEVGCGTGRVALEVLKRGVKSFFGIDISDQSIEKAMINLKHYENKVHLLVCDILDFKMKDTFDVVYSVLTLIHVKEKETAIKHMVVSLKKGGTIILSLTNDQTPYLKYGDRLLELYPEHPEVYCKILRECGCRVVCVKVHNSKFATIIKAIKIS